jgi:hypothetical protein
LATPFGEFVERVEAAIVRRAMLTPSAPARSHRQRIAGAAEGVAALLAT